MIFIYTFKENIYSDLDIIYLRNLI